MSGSVRANLLLLAISFAIAGLVGAPWGTKGCIWASRAFLPSSPPPVDPIGTLDMLSTPPPMTRSCMPAITPMAAKFTACWPDPQNRFSVTPEAVRGSQPAASTAFRPMQAA